jgi:hypothetical protein
MSQSQQNQPDSVGQKMNLSSALNLPLPQKNLHALGEEPQQGNLLDMLKNKFSKVQDGPQASPLLAKLTGIGGSTTSNFSLLDKLKSNLKLNGKRDSDTIDVMYDEGACKDKSEEEEIVIVSENNSDTENQGMNGGSQEDLATKRKRHLDQLFEEDNNHGKNDK